MKYCSRNWKGVVDGEVLLGRGLEELQQEQYYEEDCYVRSKKAAGTDRIEINSYYYMPCGWKSQRQVS